jgi:hypothetical protein
MGLRPIDVILKGMCHIQDASTGLVGPMHPTARQKDFLLNLSGRDIAVKHRQAGQTTLMVMWLLVECGLRPGHRGALIAESWATAQEAFRRLLLAHDNLPEPIKRAMGARRSSMSGIEFAHGGGIVCLSGGTRTPAIGRSIDRLVLTELGWWRDGAESMRHIAPAYRARPGAKVVIESTPGPEGCYYHDLVQASVANPDPEWVTTFLSWRDDPWIQAYPGGPDAFKAAVLAGEYAGDERLFSNQYPDTVLSGFTGSSSPTIPNEVVSPLLPGITLPTDATRLPKGQYILTCDPAGFGDHGDPSGLAAWRITDRCLQDEAVLLGRYDPGDLAVIIARWVTDLRASGSTVSTVAVESNASACVQALRDAQDIPLHWTSKSHPGWQATAARKGAAISRLVGGIRTGSVTIRSSQTIRHLLSYSEAPGARIAGHHQELAICSYIAADVGIDLMPAIKSEPAPLVVQSIYDAPYRGHSARSRVQSRRQSWR